MSSAGKTCHYCKRPMNVSDGSYEENPFCTACYRERVELAVAQDPVVGWREENDYLVPVRQSDIKRR